MIITLIAMSCFCYIMVSNHVRNNVTVNSRKNDDISKAKSLYNNFLCGKQSALNGDGNLSLKDIFRFDNENTIKYNQYALFDMNGDNIPELLLRSVGPCYILTIKDCLNNKTPSI